MDLIMSETGVFALDETVILADQWLNELMRAVDWDDKHRAYRLLRATLHALRDQLAPHEAVRFGAQLPVLMRGLYYAGWRIRETSEQAEGAFLAHIEAAFKQDPNADTEGLVREVFKLLAHKCSPVEIKHVKNLLPANVRSLWPPAHAKE
jgi:uncharacterized protein (DUF2267 family)